MAAGVTAQLSHGLLTVIGSSPKAPVVIDILATASRRGVSGVVVVEGVAMFRASDVKKVVISEMVGEPVVIHRESFLEPSVPGQSAPVRLTSAAETTDPTTDTRHRRPTPDSPPTGDSTETAGEMAIVNAVNAVRAQNGLAPLAVNAKLAKAAHIHAHDMARLQHHGARPPGAAQPGLIDRANFVGYNFTTMGENIAYNYPDTASVMNGWMNSPGHRANILGADYTEIGVGIALNSAGEPYYCQVFGHPA